MKSNLFLIAFLLLINQAFILLPIAKRKEFLSKFAEEIAQENAQSFKKKKADLYGPNNIQKLEYNLDEIIELM